MEITNEQPAIGALQHSASQADPTPQPEKPAEPAPAAAARPLSVLIDALNRDLETGTGISTYSRQLSRALKRLGHSTSWLFGRPVRLGQDVLTPEVLFHDRPAPDSRLGRMMTLATHWRHSLVGGEIVPERVQTSDIVIRDPDRPFEKDAYNASRLYSLAHHRHMATGRFTTVKAPKDVDVLHLSSALPLRMKNVRTVVTIHDLIPIRLPYTTLDNKREIIRRLRTCVEQADLVVTVSEASKADICTYLGAPPEKVEVTYQCSDMEPFRPSERHLLPRVLRRYGLDVQRYALFVSAIEPKKNLRRLIEAFLETDSGLPLVVVGKKAWMWEREIGELEATVGAKAMRRLRFLGYVPRADLRYIYAGAMFLTFPSLYEGFGLPPLEAMMSGCPVLASNTASLPEVCGEAALYVDPFDRDDMREKIERIINEPQLRDWLSKAGRARAESFSFDRYVERLGRAYKRLA